MHAVIIFSTRIQGNIVIVHACKTSKRGDPAVNEIASRQPCARSAKLRRWLASIPDSQAFFLLRYDSGLRRSHAELCEGVARSQRYMYGGVGDLTDSAGGKWIAQRYLFLICLGWLSRMVYGGYTQYPFYCANGQSPPFRFLLQAVYLF